MATSRFLCKSHPTVIAVKAQPYFKIPASKPQPLLNPNVNPTHPFLHLPSSPIPHDMEREPPQTPAENPPPRPTSPNEQELRDLLCFQALKTVLLNHPDQPDSFESVDKLIDDMISEVEEIHPGISLVNAMWCLILTSLDIGRVPEILCDVMGVIREDDRLIDNKIAENKKWAEERVMDIRRLGLEKVVDEWIREKERKLAEENEAIRKKIEKYKQEVRRVEEENETIRNEIEKDKLEQRKVGWEARKEMLAKEMAEVKVKGLHLKMGEVDEAMKEAEAKWMEEEKAREEDGKQFQDTRDSDICIEVNRSIKKMHDEFPEEIHAEQPDQYNTGRLEQEPSSSTSPLKYSPQKIVHSSTLPPTFGDASEKRAPENILNRKDPGYTRKCLACMTNEASVLFLPCADRFLCAACDSKRSDTICLLCGARIHERITVR